MLVVAGETIVDMIADNNTPMRFNAYLGGGPYNVAKAAAKMGQDTGYISPLSTDKFGEAFLQELKKLGVAALSDPSARPSGLAIVQTDESGHPSYNFHREHAADRDISIQSILQSYPQNTSCFYIGGLALADNKDGEIWAEFTQGIKAAVFCDPNIRPSFIRDRGDYVTRLERIYDACDIIKLSDEDIGWLEPSTPPREYLKNIMNTHEITVGFLTLGSQGAEVHFEGQTAFEAAPKIKVKDTVGAGDCFSGAAIASILRTNSPGVQTIESLKYTLQYSVIAAAINCMRSGANAPTHQEISEALEKQILTKK